MGWAGWLFGSYGRQQAVNGLPRTVLLAIPSEFKPADSYCRRVPHAAKDPKVDKIVGQTLLRLEGDGWPSLQILFLDIPTPSSQPPALCIPLSYTDIRPCLPHK